MPELTTWGQPSIFCERHKDRHEIRRCAHLGNRFVAWVQLDDWLKPEDWCCFVDYVEDKPDGGIIVEPSHTHTVEDAQVLWQEQIEKMQAGIPPDPEAGN